MKELTKKVYYCDHCKKHGLVKHHIKRHESGCLRNPQRECKLCGATKNFVLEYNADQLTQLPDKFASHETVQKISDECGCPACVLSALVVLRIANDWDYKKAMQDYYQEKSDVF
jgi:hypothetical protein